MFDKLFEKFANKVVTKIKPKNRTESLFMDLISNPDLAEINIKKIGNEIVIRIKKAEESN